MLGHRAKQAEDTLQRVWLGILQAAKVGRLLRSGRTSCELQNRLCRV